MDKIKITGMIKIKDYLCSLLVGKKFHFKCDCSLPIDVIGEVKSFKQVGMDYLLYVNVPEKEKLVIITLNHPNIMIEEVK